MPYCTKQNMIDRYGDSELIQLTDRVSAGVIDDVVLNQAIDDADGLINGYLASRYKVPITPVPQAIEKVACEIARYYLYDDNATDQVSKRYDDAVKFLKGVARGDVALGVDDQGASAPSQNTPEMQSGGNVFNRKDTGFI